MAATVHITDRASAVAAVLDEPERIRPVFQPIFDLQRGVVCEFEMLARFEHELRAAPDKWFAAAARLGLGDARPSLTKSGLMWMTWLRLA